MNQIKRVLVKSWDVFRIFGLPLLAVIGLNSAIKVVTAGSQPRPEVAPLVEPAKNEFASAVAGAGIVEAAGENISIASHAAGVVSTVHVKVGDKVTIGAPLFSLDDRSLQAERSVREGSLLVAKAERREAHAQVEFAERLSDKRALSIDELTRRRNALAVAEARVTEIERALEKIDVELSLLTVTAPIAGEVLRVNVRPGEFAPAQQIATPLMLLGNTSRLWVRVDIDENSAWRVSPGATAKAYLRGNPQLSVPLQFVRFERFVTPKRSLSGDNSERVDTRVLQVIYDFDPTTIPVYVGQLMDVYIEAKAHG